MILITGGMGFIGLHTARRFLDAGESVVVTQFRVRRTPDFIKDELGKRVIPESLDVTSPHDILDLVRKHRQMPASSIIDEITRELTAFSGGAPPNDDITLVIVRRLE